MGAVTLARSRLSLSLSFPIWEMGIIRSTLPVSLGLVRVRSDRYRGGVLLWLKDYLRAKGNLEVKVKLVTVTAPVNRALICARGCAKLSTLITAGLWSPDDISPFCSRGPQGLGRTAVTLSALGRVRGQTQKCVTLHPATS